MPFASRPLIHAVLILACWTLALLSQERGSRIYVSTFQNGQMKVFNSTGGKPLRSIAVEDEAGAIGLEVSRDGRKIFIVDGNAKHRLRIFDAGTGRISSEHPFPNRLLQPGGAPAIHLTADGNWLFVKTYDYAAAAAGVRVFDVTRGAFLPVGLRNRACESPLMASVPGALFLACSGWIQEMSGADSSRAGDFAPVRKVPIPIEQVADIAAAGDGANIYVLEGRQPAKDWRLIDWPRKEAKARSRSLTKVLNPASDGRDAAIAASKGSIGIVHGAQAWILGDRDMEVRHSAKLPGLCQGASFAAGQSELMTIASAQGALVGISAMDGKLRVAELDTFDRSAKPIVLRAAPAPQP